MKIIADRNMKGLQQIFSDLSTVELVDGRALRQSQLGDADVLLVRSVTRVNEALLKGSQVRFVGTATSGVDHIDQDYLSEQGIGFSHAPGSNANSVVEYVLAAICHSDDFLERLLSGQSLGIIGGGHVGRALAECAQSLGIRCCTYDPWLAPAEAESVTSLAHVLDCSVISVHAELTHRAPWPSFHLLGRELLETIPADRLLINAGRGEIIDGAALLERLHGGSGPRTVLDVWENEPRPDPKLLSLVSLGTPHIAGYSLDGKLLATRMLRAAMGSFFDLETGCDVPDGDAPPALKVPAGLQGADLLRWAIRSRYDIAADDRRLRELMLDSTVANPGFDVLRNNYPERRELKGSIALLTGGHERQAMLLRALGCIIQPAVEVL